jgi:tetratricopeptide (TPR) repeat protein
MSFDRASTGFNDTRLDTWKAIAQYLGRSSRTAQRWHAEYGLPIHHLGGDASSVFAYTDELESWLRNRGGNLPDHRTQQRSPVEALPPMALAEKRLQGPQRREMETAPDDEREAAELVDQAQRLWESLSGSNLSAIARMYRRAVDLDASNARAFAGLAQALIAQSVLGNLHPSVALRTAEAALQRAVDIDPGLFEAQCASSMLRILLHREWSEARKLLDEALSRRPQASQALVGRAFLAVAQNSLTEASEYLRRASGERPLNSSLAELLCWVEYLSGRFESTLALIAEARETGHSGAIIDTVEALSSVLLMGPLAQVGRLESMVTSAPRNYSLIGVLGFAYGQIGQLDAARGVIESMTRTGISGAVDFAYPIALTFLGMGNRAEALKWLEQSYAHGSLWSLGFKTDPMLSGLRDEAPHSPLFGPRRYPEADLYLRRELDVEKPSMPYSA